MAELVLYRIVKTNPPTAADFFSNKAKGLPRRANEAEDIWTGLSHYDNVDRARATARRFPRLGTFIAAVGLTERGPFRVEQTFYPGHYTVWGEPQDFLNAVRAVEPVEPASADGEKHDDNQV